MVKPIFVVRIPVHAPEETPDQASKVLRKELSDDYYVIIFTDPDADKLTFECFNAADAPKITEEKLKEMERLILKGGK